MIHTHSPSCGKEVRISGGGTEMEWDIEGRTARRNGDFHKSWACPFCYGEHFQSEEKTDANARNAKSTRQDAAPRPMGRAIRDAASTR